MATSTLSLGTSNVGRGHAPPPVVPPPSRQTRTNPSRPTRSSKPTGIGSGSSLRQNSLISNPPPSLPGATPLEPHGFYPAIQHFTDAITALPRDYRRHTTLFKEVDAKAWQPEENLQALLAQCLSDKPIAPQLQTLPSTTASIANMTDGDHILPSAANSVTGIPPDAASQLSAQTTSSTAAPRRQLFTALRHNLMQIMVTMDEKNHVINDANEELSRHMRRIDSIWPEISNEISEEARLGSLKHWALTWLNPPKKSAPTTRREQAAANLASLRDEEVAARSESRREAVAAKSKQRLDRNAQLETGYEDARTSKKRAAEEKKRAADAAVEATSLGGAPSGAGKGKKKPATGLALEKAMSTAITGGRAMSREPSQLDNMKKRKAPAGTTVARKRLNAAQDSPKLAASSPLASTFGKDAYKRSPALGAARPVSNRGRQNSTQTAVAAVIAADGSSRARPASSASQRNGNGPTSRMGNTSGVSASIPELKGVAAATGRSANEVKNLMKEVTNSKGERVLVDEDLASINGIPSDVSARGGGFVLERKGSTKGLGLGGIDLEGVGHHVKNTHLSGMGGHGLAPIATERIGRGRASKPATPVVPNFSEAATSFGDTADQTSNHANKAKRPARPRARDYGLHDSLSPRGLPPKRRNGGASIGGVKMSSQDSMSGGNQHRRQNSRRDDSETRLASTVDGGGDEDGDVDMDDARPSTEDHHQQQQQSRRNNRGRSDLSPSVSPEPEENNTTNNNHGNNKNNITSRTFVAEPLAASQDSIDDADADIEADADADADAAGDEADPADLDADPEAEADAEDETLYCYCQGPSFGEMIGCDNKNCRMEWFHLECIGLASAPKGKWFCRECKDLGNGGGKEGGGGGNGKGGARGRGGGR